VPRSASTTDLVGRARAGDARAVARLISLVEDGSDRLREVMAQLAPHVGRARVVGLTGPPGVGKSTTTSALVAAYRARGERVGVLAVDPSSPFSGGALLGDRVRMQEHALDQGVFIRSMASRGHLGGLAWATPQALRVLDAAGCDVVLIETVGVGQSEVEVAGTADTVVVLMAPGMGDGVQAAKAGILEIGDVYVVNKADREGADTTVRELRYMLSLGHRDGSSGWTPPILKTVASRGEGLAEVVGALDDHRAWLESSGQLQVRRRRRAEAEIQAIAVTSLRARMDGLRQGLRPGDLADQVATGRLDPYTAADRLIAGVTG
jgi:LAO/AO transport system kinase